MRRLAILLLAAALAAPAAAGEGSAVDKPKLNPAITGAAPNKWLTLHEQKPEDKVRFRLQEHGGSCFDTKRGQIVLFGSNTHGKDWTNSPLFFDVAACEWKRAYEDDAKETYKVNAEGLPVAGQNGDHPWATHTFGCVIYDPGRDEMVVACYPGHMIPGRFTNALGHVWGQVKRHPTWTYSFATGKWTPLPCKAVHFFPNAATWDSDRKSVIGYGGSGLWELGGEPREWKKHPGSSMFGWHNNCVYDTKQKAVVVFGTNQNSDEVVVFKPASDEHKKMPTPGKRPPPDQHNPMCFDENSGVTVLIADRATDAAKKTFQGETWIYDLGKDAWRQLPEATLPFGCGMNYTMEYDPHHKACLLVANAPAKFGRAVSVFALKVDPAKLGAEAPAGGQAPAPAGK